MRRILLSLFAAFSLAAVAGACSDDGEDGTGGGGGTGAGTGASGGGGGHVCGNGVLEAGESCDPCPAVDCFGDPMACIAPTFVQDPDTCLVTCGEDPITTCGMDGCCASGCTDDPDCDCDASSDCDACFSCAGNGPCEAAVSACESNPICIEYVNCTGACTDDACVQACQQAADPDAIAAFEAWFSCVLCDVCTASCVGYSNIAFPGCN